MGLPYRLLWMQLSDDRQLWTARSGTVWSQAPGAHPGLRGTKFWVIPDDDRTHPVLVGEAGQAVAPRLATAGLDAASMVCLTTSEGRDASRARFFGQLQAAPVQDERFEPAPFMVGDVRVDVEDRDLYWRWSWDRIAPPWYDVPAVHNVELSKRPPHLLHASHRSGDSFFINDLPTPASPFEVQGLVTHLIRSGADVRAGNSADALYDRTPLTHLPRHTGLTCNCIGCKRSEPEYKLLGPDHMAELVWHRQDQHTQLGSALTPEAVALAAVLPFVGEAHLERARALQAGATREAAGWRQWLIGVDEVLRPSVPANDPRAYLGALWAAGAGIASSVFHAGPKAAPGAVQEARAAWTAHTTAVIKGDWAELESRPEPVLFAPATRPKPPSITAAGRGRGR
jgi:hypothetical protein